MSNETTANPTPAAAPADDFDLAGLDSVSCANAGAVLHLEHPTTGKPTPGWIKLLGADSDAYTARMRDLQRDRLNRAADTQRRGRNAQRKAISPEELETEALDLIVLATLEWGGIVINRQSVPFSPGHVRGLYVQYPWIREQVEEFVTDRQNFLPKSASS